MTSLGDLLGRLDPDDNVRGNQFERICKWYLEHDPVYSGQLTRVWLWKDWPGRWYPKKEAGIDLVAKHRDGTLWAIQAKAYDSAYSVTKEDMNSFLSESNRKDDNTGRYLFSYRLLIATTDKLGSTPRNTMNAQAIPVGHLGRTDLNAAEIDWPASPSDLRAPRLPPKEPKGRWAYQGEAMNNVVNEFRQADRGKLIMACGTGKTLTALFIRETLSAERTLVLVPSLQLMKQTIGAWRSNKKVDFEYLPVCSDETVSKDDNDMPVSSTSDLGLPVTTDPDEIAKFLRRRSGPRVVFATYQSSPQIAKAFKLGHVPAFDLAIADEAHRCAAPHSSEFATILDNEKIKARRRLFMTATSRIYSARVLKATKEAGFEFASMDDEVKFGKVFHRITFREAIERDLLTDYQVAIIGVDNATYRAWAEKAWFITIHGKEVTDARAVAGQIGLAKAMRKYDLRRVITFHRLVKGAKAFEASFPEVVDWIPTRQRPKGKLWTDYVAGTMPAGERHRRLQSLSEIGEDERAVISNARCLTEGIDVPTLDGVAFIDPKRSEIDIVQAVGRAIRLADGKKIGTIVIPVFINSDEPNPEVILDDSAFKAVWDVLVALRSHDDELAQQLDELRRMLGQRNRGGSLRLPPKIHIDIPDVCGADFARAFDVRLVEQTTASWEFWFGLLERFVENYAHALVPQSHAVNDYKLGWWVAEQRQALREGKLNSDRKRRLDGLPGWTWDILAQRWEDGFSHLLRYVDQHGHARVPQPYTVGGYRLGSWLYEQRQALREGKLDPARKRRLEALPGWTWEPNAAKWEEGFSHLLRYVDQHGHTRVPKFYSVNGFPLGSWVIQQRYRYKNAEDAGATDRRHRFGELPGWTWDTKGEQWEEGFSHLLRYVDQHGHARVPHSYTVDGYRLGTWVHSQRNNYVKGTLEVDREHRLGELLSWTWDPFAAMWEEGFSHLLRYVDQHGHARVPTSYTVDGYRLGGWVVTQRTFRASERLDADRQQRLSNVPGWSWDARADQWEEGFSHLLRYVDQHGHARMPQSYTIDGYRLGKWLAKQRTRHSEGTLDSDRERRLQGLPGWTWDARDYIDRWEDGFNRLLRYVELNGNARVPSSYTVDDYKLGRWVIRQRANHAKGTLNADRQHRLQDLTDWTWKTR